MQWRSWSFVDKSTWGPGPWQDEPDKLQWTDADTGLPCLIVRSSWHGALCGYVGVAEGHPAFARDHDEVDVTVHGGLTFSDFCDEGEEYGICHIPAPGETERVWWLGFDAGHARDLRPAWAASGLKVSFVDCTYRDLAYMQEQCAVLAAQLVEMSTQKAGVT